MFFHEQVQDKTAGWLTYAAQGCNCMENKGLLQKTQRPGYIFSVAFIAIYNTL